MVVMVDKVVEVEMKVEEIKFESKVVDVVFLVKKLWGDEDDDIVEFEFKGFNVVEVEIVDDVVD